MTKPSDYTEIQKVLENYASKELVDKILKEFEFGSVLFGDRFSKLQGKRKEKDTRPEEIALDNIVSFVDGPDTQNKNFIKKNASFFNSVKNKAPKILKEPRGWVYRGTSLKRNFVKPFFKNRINFIKSFKECTIDGKKCYKYIKTINYTPRASVTSWSKVFNVAVKFIGNDSFQAIYATKTNSNFLFNPSFMNRLSTNSVGNKEFETISTNKKHKCLLFLTYATYMAILDEVFDDREDKKGWWNSY